MESLLPSPGCHGARRPTLPATIPAGVSAAGDPGHATLRHEAQPQRSHGESAAAGARLAAPP
jgi:hypothetical protein